MTSLGRRYELRPLVAVGLLVAAVGIFASGCGGGSSSSESSVTISGTAVRGPMMGSLVEAFNVNAKTGLRLKRIGSTTTGGDGTFTLRLHPAPLGPVRLIVTGGSFVSEMNGDVITPDVMSVLLPKPRHRVSGVSINPISTLVASRAVGEIESSKVEFEEALKDATSAVEKDYAISKDPVGILPDFTAGGIGTDEGNLGLALGAIVNEDQCLCPSHVGGLSSALAQDFADGYYDGAAFGRPVPYCDGNLPAIAGTADFQDALSGLYQLHNVTKAFDFGGKGNILTINGIADIALDGANSYPPAPLAAIQTAIVNAAPPSVNTFANPQSAMMNHGRSSATITVLPNGKVLIAGGLATMRRRSQPRGYDPATNSFQNPQSAVMNERAPRNRDSAWKRQGADRRRLPQFSKRARQHRIVRPGQQLLRWAGGLALRRSADTGNDGAPTRPGHRDPAAEWQGADRRRQRWLRQSQ